MGEVKRYDVHTSSGDAGTFGAMEESRNGDWIRRSDYDALHAEVGRLRAMLEQSQTFIGTFVGDKPEAGRSFYAGRLWDQINETLAEACWRKG